MLIFYFWGLVTFNILQQELKTAMQRLISFSTLLGWVRFFVDYQIKQHASLLILKTVYSFRFRGCPCTSQVE